MFHSIDFPLKCFLTIIDACILFLHISGVVIMSAIELVPLFAPPVVPDATAVQRAFAQEILAAGSL